MRSGDCASAQSVIDAAGITVPTGDLCDGCYDEGGALYKLPEHIVADPTDLAPDKTADEVFYDGETVRSGTAASASAGDSRSAADEGFRKLSKHDTLESTGDVAVDGQGPSHHEKLEKGMVNERDLIQVKARLSFNGQDIILNIGKDQPVQVLERRIRDEVQVGGNPSLVLQMT